MLDTKTIQQMQADLNTFRSKGSSTPAPTPAPTSSTPIANDPKFDQIKADLASIRAGNTTPATIPKDNPNVLAQFAKGLFSAPATIVARPFQAGAELLGAKSEDVDKLSHDISGGLIAPVPQNFGDVKKDVGRAAQTIALGSAAPIAGGALFGAGASLEEGNNLLSAQTAIDAALGGAGGKVLDWVGKPILSATGKIIGTITPKSIKDVAAKGSDAITKFAADHQLLGGVAAKPSEAFAGGLQKIDTTINSGFKKGGDVLKKTAAEQFPGLDPVKHYIAAAEKDLVKPTTLNDSKFSKATSIYKNAQARGIDLPKVATENRVFHDDNVGAGKFNTSETEQGLRNQVYGEGADVIRPAIQEIQLGVQRVPISEVRTNVLSRVDDLPAAKYNAEEKQAMRETIEKRYADNSPEAKAHPDGYSLEELHNARIERGLNGKYIPGVSDAPTVASARLARQEEKVFRDLFDRNLPKKIMVEGKLIDNPLVAIRRKHEETLLLADYLKALNGKKVPEGTAKKAVRLFGRAAAATVGGKIGGFPGAILGSQYGDILFSSFAELPNPLKKVVLDSLEKQKSPLFDVLSKFMKSSAAEREAMLALPAPGGSSFKEKRSTLFTTPGGVSTPHKGEAIDLTAVEQGRAKKPMSLKDIKF